MEKIWRDTFFIYSQYINTKIDNANKIIIDSLDKYEKPYIAYSGGKDSIVMTYLVMQHKPDIMVYHHDQGQHMPNEIRVEIQNILYELGTKNVRWESPERKFWDDILIQYIKEGYDCCFVGLRKEESKKRKSRIVNNNYLTQLPEIWPLQNWSWMDVWAFIIKNKLSYPSTYNTYARLYGWNNVRFHSFFDPSMNKFGCQNVDGILNWKYRNM